MSDTDAFWLLKLACCGLTLVCVGPRILENQKMRIPSERFNSNMNTQLFKAVMLPEERMNLKIVELDIFNQIESIYIAKETTWQSIVAQTGNLWKQRKCCILGAPEFRAGLSPGGKSMKTESCTKHKTFPICPWTVPDNQPDSIQNSLHLIPLVLSHTLLFAL